MESVSRIAGIVDPARGLTVEAAQAAGISRKLGATGPSRSISSAKLKALLDSRSDREILDGLRKVIAMIYQSRPCLLYFSSVVKNVANPNIEVKKLVYVYLLHYAESDPDLALLSVNAIQKSLSDQNPQVRAMALRTMAGMRVPVISQIVSLAIKRGVGDMSPHVRKAAALAIPKCYRLDPNCLPQLLDYLSTLLTDKQYFVVGPAVQAFLEICPDRIDLIHKHYRSLVRKLADMDEWGQLATLRLLLHYCRKCFPQKTYRNTKINKKGFYDDEPDEIIDNGDVVPFVDPDLALFLKACRLLLSSRNPAIIVAVASCYLYLGTPDYVKEAIGPLVALTRGPPEIQEVALCNLVLVALSYSSLFVEYAPRFLIRDADSETIWRLKLELLTLIFPHADHNLKSIILCELEQLSHSAHSTQIQDAVRAIGRCAQSDQTTSSRCFRVLLNQVTSSDNVLVSEVLTVMRHLIQRDPDSHMKTVIRLARNLDRTTSSAARATIIWLVGEFVGTDPQKSIAADVVRILVKGFASESEAAKHQIVLLAAKVYLHYIQALPGQPSNTSGIETRTEPYEELEKQAPATQVNLDHPISKIWEYILLLCRYDTSYDLRDRARLFNSLLSNPSSTQLAALLILAPKPVPHSPSPSETRKGLTLGSTTLVLGKDIAGVNGLSGYEEIPPWVEAGSEPNPKLRDLGGGEKEGYISETKRNIQTAAARRLDEAVKEQGLEKVVAKGTSKGRSLNDWLEESEAEESEAEESETNSEEEETESEEESEAETEEDESEDETGQMEGESKALVG